MNNPSLELQIQTLPDNPGVYQYYDKEGKIKKTSNWMDYFMYTFESDWYEELELQYWYSK